MSIEGVGDAAARVLDAGPPAIVSESASANVSVVLLLPVDEVGGFASGDESIVLSGSASEVGSLDSVCSG